MIETSVTSPAARLEDKWSVVGLTGKQGVLIPATNVRHLILRSDVVKAVAEGKFHIYPVKTIDEGMAILTGVIPHDKPGPDGINDAVATRLRELRLD